MKKTGAVANIYNVTPNAAKAVFTVISQVGDYCINVSLTLTSTMMREEPSPEQAKGEEEPFPIVLGALLLETSIFS